MSQITLAFFLAHTSSHLKPKILTQIPHQLFNSTKIGIPQPEKERANQKLTKTTRSMKLVWSPENASKAYLDTVKSCDLFQDSSVAELISAMAAGWNAKLIVETWSQGGATATSVGLTVASHHSGGRHVCIVPNEQSKLEFVEAIRRVTGKSPEVIVGEPEDAVAGGGLTGIDFLVVDCRRDDFKRMLRVAKLGQRGAVLVCKNVNSRGGSGGAADFRWCSVLGGGSRVVRTVFLPVGKGLDIAHVGAAGGGRIRSGSRWMKHIDRESGEEVVIRK